MTASAILGGAVSLWAAGVIADVAALSENEESFSIQYSVGTEALGDELLAPQAEASDGVYPLAVGVAVVVFAVMMAFGNLLLHHSFQKELMVLLNSRE